MPQSPAAVPSQKDVADHQHRAADLCDAPAASGSARGVNQPGVGSERGYQARQKQAEPSPGNHAADAGELANVDEAIAQPAAACYAACGLKQIAETNEVRDWNGCQHSQATQQARQAKEPLERVTQA